jgi:hypothetical protein
MPLALSLALPLRLVSLAQSFNLTVDDVDALCLRRAWESWHAKDVAGYGYEHFRTAVDDEVADVHIEAFRASVEFLVG